MTAYPLPQIRADLAGRLATVPGLRASPYMVANPQVPMACVIPRRGDYLADLERGDADHDLEVWIYVNPADLEQAQKSIDEYLSPTGAVLAAIEQGGSFRVSGYDDYARMVDVAGSSLMGVALQVQVTR